MIRSGIKRGLAVSALSALAVAGLPAIAHANQVDTQVTAVKTATGVTLYNTDVPVSTKSDGTDNTVRLQAGGGTMVARVTFQFEKSTTPGNFVDIATVSTRNDDGSFSFEWNPTANGVFPGDAIRLRVVNADATTTSDTSTQQIVASASAVNTNTINVAAGSQKGYFVDPTTAAPHVGVTGTVGFASTAAADRPLVAWMDGAGNRNNSALAELTEAGKFAGIVDLTAPYVFDNPALPPAEADQVVIQGLTNNPGVQTEDFEAYTLYKQTITTVTATVGNRVFPDPSTVTITVLDQAGQPVAGVDVTERNGAAPVGTTRGDGKLVLPQALFDGTTYVYANADANNGNFSPAAGDVRSNTFSNATASVSISANPSRPNLAVGTSVTETITVRDDNGNPVANRAVRITRRSPGLTETIYRTTNNAGVVTYTFSGNRPGVTSITAAIGIPGDTPPFTNFVDSATDFITFGGSGTGNGGREAIRVNMTGGQANGGKTDILRIRITGDNSAAGAKTTLYRKVGRKSTVVGVSRINRNDRAEFRVRDLNGVRALTKYFVRVAQTNDTLSRRGPVKQFR